jgi:hypothetical protein
MVESPQLWRRHHWSTLIASPWCSGSPKGSLLLDTSHGLGLPSGRKMPDWTKEAQLAPQSWWSHPGWLHSSGKSMQSLGFLHQILSAQGHPTQDSPDAWIEEVRDSINDIFPHEDQHMHWTGMPISRVLSGRKNHGLPMVVLGMSMWLLSLTRTLGKVPSMSRKLMGEAWCIRSAPCQADPHIGRSGSSTVPSSKVATSVLQHGRTSM